MTARHTLRPLTGPGPGPAVAPGPLAGPAGPGPGRVQRSRTFKLFGPGRYAASLAYYFSEPTKAGTEWESTMKGQNPRQRRGSISQAAAGVLSGLADKLMKNQGPGGRRDGEEQQDQQAGGMDEDLSGVGAQAQMRRGRRKSISDALSGMAGKMTLKRNATAEEVAMHEAISSFISVTEGATPKAASNGPSKLVQSDQAHQASSLGGKSVKPASGPHSGPGTSGATGNQNTGNASHSFTVDGVTASPERPTVMAARRRGAEMLERAVASPHQTPRGAGHLERQNSRAGSGVGFAVQDRGDGVRAQARLGAFSESSSDREREAETILPRRARSYVDEERASRGVL
eukprot:3156665-Rhodomonas_salina.1